jgi:hypothetical protein
MPTDFHNVGPRTVLLRLTGELVILHLKLRLMLLTFLVYVHDLLTLQKAFGSCYFLTVMLLWLG